MVNYYFTIWFVDLEPNTLESFLCFNCFFRASGLYHLIMFTYTIPVWWTLFIYFERTEFKYKLLSHILFLPLWVFATNRTYYFLSDVFDYSRLSGNAIYWDVYICALFYIIQFSFFHGYELFKLHEQKIKDNIELNTLAIKNELSALKAQLNPHFLYNTFNAISASVPSENEHTRELIAKLSDLFRIQLSLSSKDFVEIKTEIELITIYLELEKERFQDKLDYSIEVEQGLEDYLIPPMLLQPLVENSIKHGTSKLLDKGSIQLKCFSDENHIRFQITDNGPGFKNYDQQTNNGIGLANTELRLKKMYKETLHIENNTPNGVIISFRIPLAKLTK